MNDTIPILAVLCFALYAFHFMVLQKHELAGILMSIPCRAWIAGKCIHQTIYGDAADAIYGFAIVFFMSYEYDWFWKVGLVLVLIGVIVN